MIINNMKYGISLLPTDCMAYKDGYRYGAYRQNLDDKRDDHVLEFFKTREEVQNFVNNNKEYAK